MTIAQVPPLNHPYSASQAGHEIKCFPVISLWRDLKMVNSAAKSSNLFLSHVRSREGPCTLYNIVTVRDVTAKFQNRFLAFTYNHARDPRIVRVDQMSWMFPGKYDRGWIFLSGNRSAPHAWFLQSWACVENGNQRQLYSQDWNEFINQLCCFWTAKEQTQSVVNGRLNVTIIKSSMSRNKQFNPKI